MSAGSVIGPDTVVHGNVRGRDASSQIEKADGAGAATTTDYIGFAWGLFNRTSERCIIPLSRIGIIAKATANIPIFSGARDSIPPKTISKHANTNSELPGPGRI